MMNFLVRCDKCPNPSHPSPKNFDGEDGAAGHGAVCPTPRASYVS